MGRGDLNGASFSFFVVDERYFREGQKLVREILDIELHELGPVTFPAYKGTSATLRGIPVMLRETEAAAAESEGLDMDLELLGLANARAGTCVLPDGREITTTEYKCEKLGGEFQEDFDE